MKISLVRSCESQSPCHPECKERSYIRFLFNRNEREGKRKASKSLSLNRSGI